MTKPTVKPTRKERFIDAFSPSFLDRDGFSWPLCPIEPLTLS
ncbi:hypothetical protein ACQR16_04480 [Bradyrhizobium oligotrophicum]